MNELKEIKTIPKSGNEILTSNGEKIGYKLLDFWRWSVSDIVSNAARGRFAEFIVGTALGFKLDNIRNEWDAYDLKTKEGIKIEVKSSAYIQSWNQKDYSPISFSIKPARYWDAATNIQDNKPIRHADLYVFCLLKHKDQDTIDPLKMEQWDFYVLPTYRLDNYKRSQSSITINSLKKLTEAKKFIELEEEIIKAYNE
ncbi:MAG: PRC-barrel domain-containing protein [Bacteroidales bacterium]|nr:PRC-barrel domain-containing protein [Bacteroidales bacterium]MDD4830480.1 PRC-barrel domain-containing protein [Bacteroidales bacterium]